MVYYGNNDWRDYLLGRALAHHGIKGQKWGVRRGPPYPIGEQKGFSSSSEYGKLNSGSRKSVKLSPQEYAHVMHEVATHITKEQRYDKSVFSKSIGPYTYMFENQFDGTFRVLRKTPIPGTATEFSRKGKF